MYDQLYWIKLFYFYFILPQCIQRHAKMPKIEYIPHVILSPKYRDVGLATMAAKIPEMYMIIGIIATYVAGNSNVVFKYSAM